MKKVITIAAVALLGIVVLPSCKKDYKCTCSWNVNGVPGSITQDLNKMSKKDAKAACEGYINSYSAYTGVTCNLD